MPRRYRQPRPSTLLPGAQPARWYDLIDVRLRWLAGLVLALGVVGGGVKWGWATSHRQFIAADERIEQNLDKLIEWQRSKEKEASDEKAKEAERARIKACLDEGKTPEECL